MSLWSLGHTLDYKQLFLCFWNSIFRPVDIDQGGLLSLSCSCYHSPHPLYILLVLSHSQMVLLVDSGPFLPSPATHSCHFYTTVLYQALKVSWSLSFTPGSLSNLFSSTTGLDLLQATSSIVRHPPFSHTFTPQLSLESLGLNISFPQTHLHTLGPCRTCPIKPVIVSSMIPKLMIKKSRLTSWGCTEIWGSIGQWLQFPNIEEEESNDNYEDADNEDVPTEQQPPPIIPDAFPVVYADTNFI